MSDLAHIHHVELHTPEPEQSLAYLHDVLGMEIESRAGQSVFLRAGATTSRTRSSSPKRAPPASPTWRDRYAPTEGIVLDDGRETGAWLSLTSAAHELIYVADARGAGERLHHLAFWVDTREECLRAADIFLDAGVHIEAAPSRHAVAAGFFLHSFEPGGNRIEVTTGGYLVYEPDAEPLMWTEAERGRGQAWASRLSRAPTTTAPRRPPRTRGYALAAGVAAP
ncbi:MAG: VOC family protein [Solirubrobacteraceae bacterium]